MSVLLACGVFLCGVGCGLSLWESEWVLALMFLVCGGFLEAIRGVEI